MTICLGVVSTSSLFSCDEMTLVDETTGEEIYDSCISFEWPVFRETKEIQRKPLLHLLYFMCLQLRIINTPMWDLGSWHVLSFYSPILGCHILLLFTKKLKLRMSSSQDDAINWAPSWRSLYPYSSGGIPSKNTKEQRILWRREGIWALLFVLRKYIKCWGNY